MSLLGWRRGVLTLPRRRLVGGLLCCDRGLGGMVQAWVDKKLVNVTFYEFFLCPIYKYLR
jgi:hypothetical protein